MPENMCLISCASLAVLYCQGFRACNMRKLGGKTPDTGPPFALHRSTFHPVRLLHLKSTGTRCCYTEE
uniref:Putative secreted protein n=1 Tax=Anopheles darlingi TaxID=43151 RepID=A0A2M4DIL6_ANODA